jgi:cellulose synthase/poly-beta-1,6-N-acetylglucosamine synthase-like glycosyltransferase
MCAPAAILTLPPAIEHRANATDMMFYLGFVAAFGLVGYLGAFWTLWFHSRLFPLFAPHSIKTLHRASTVFGVAGLLFMPTIALVAYIIPPGNIFGVIEIGLMIAFAVTPFVIANRILRKGDSSSETGADVQSPK